MSNHKCAEGLTHVSGDAVKELVEGRKPNYSNTCFFNEYIEAIDLSGVNFYGADLRRTKWKLKTNLQNTVLVDVDLSGATLAGVDLRGADLTRANLSGVNFSGANLERAILRGCRMRDTNLDWTKLADTVVEHSGFDGAILQEREGDFRTAQEIYHVLKTNFRTVREENSARWANFREREMQRKMAAPRAIKRFHTSEFAGKNRKQSAWFFLQLWVRYIIWSIQSYTSGYGQQPLRALMTTLLLIPIFAVGYALSGGLAAEHRELFTQDYLLFSVGTLFRINPVDIKVVSYAAQWLVALESGLGLGFFAIFATALSWRATND
jgi:uncharacterized protein YjbI with pentapeptide repeats